jgi:transposase
MRYELSDKEWSFIRAMLPTKPRGVPPRRRSPRPQWHLLGVAILRPLAGSANHLWSSNHLLQSVRSLAKGRHLGPHPEGADMRT